MPVVLIHGGAGPLPEGPSVLAQRRQAICEIMNEAWPRVLAGETAVDAVTFIVGQLELSPLFNAGYGAVIQSDGMARLSASLMDGRRQKFSGVLLATHLIHPSKLAAALQERDDTVLGPLGVQLLARELGMPPVNPTTPDRARRWVEHLERRNRAERHGTVGAVVLDVHNALAAATSTGGHGANFPERVSDSATVAGNYASSHAAISCTGVGEQIVDDGVAVRLETRVRDGKNMVEASEATYAEASGRARKYGWIGVDCMGNWTMYCSTEVMCCAALWGNAENIVVG